MLSTSSPRLPKTTTTTPKPTATPKTTSVMPITPLKVIGALTGHKDHHSVVLLHQQAITATIKNNASWHLLPTTSNMTRVTPPATPLATMRTPNILLIARMNAGTNKTIFQHITSSRRATCRRRTRDTTITKI